MKTISKLLISLSLLPFSITPIFKFAQHQALGGSSSSLLDSYDIESTATVLDNYAVDYFSNLYENYGCNMWNTCGYISLSMLLSYYDSYLSEQFIPDNVTNGQQFEVTTSLSEPVYQAYRNSDMPESPGTHDDHSIIQYLNQYNLAYYTSDSNNTSSFQLKLIGFALSHYADDNVHIYSVNSDETLDFSNTLSFYSNLAFDYLDTYTTYDGDNVVQEITGSSSYVYQQTISLVQSGIPVVMLLNYTSNPRNGHIAVAYDYDSTNGLYFHMGDHSESTDHISWQTVTETYPIYSGISRAYYFDTSSIAHTETENYIYNGSSQCTCMLGYHESHVHVENPNTYCYPYNRHHWVKCRYCETWYSDDCSLIGVVRDGYMCAYCVKCGYLEQLYETGE